jgi:hypothetical protein
LQGANTRWRPWWVACLLSLLPKPILKPAIDKKNLIAWSEYKEKKKKKKRTLDSHATVTFRQAGSLR